MTKNISRGFIIGLGVLTMISVAGAAPLCTSLIGSDVNVGGNTTSISCTAGGLTFSNFAYSLAGGAGTPSIQLAGVSIVGGLVTLNFNPNENFPTGVQDIHLVFSVTGPAILGATLTNNGQNSAIQEKNCETGVSLSGTCTGTQIWNTTDFDSQTSSVTYASSETLVWVWKNINTGVNSTINGHNSSFDEGFLTTTTIPEPMTLSLMGVGLLGIGFLGRRLRK